MSTAKVKPATSARAPAAKAVPAAAAPAVAAPIIAAPVVAEAVVTASVAAAPAVPAPEAVPAPPLAAEIPVAAEIAAAEIPAALATVAEDAAKQIEHVVAAGKETLEQVVKVSQDAAAKGYEQALALTKDFQAKLTAQAPGFPSYDDAVAFGKDNLEALVKSSTILSRGLQDIGQSLLGLTKDAVEGSVAASQQLLGAKSLKDAIDLQTGVTKANFDKLVEEGSRLSDRSVKLVEEALVPIKERITATVERLGKPIA